MEYFLDWGSNSEFHSCRTDCHTYDDEDEDGGDDDDLLRNYMLLT